MSDNEHDLSNEQLRARLSEVERELAQAQTAVTRERKALAELRRSEELTRRLIEAMPGGVVHVAATGAIELANAEALRVLGLSYDELTKRYAVDFETQTLYEDGRPCPAEDYPVTRALVSGEAQPARTIGVRRPDGETSWAVFTAVPIKGDDGTTHGAVVTFLDITDRKRLEERLREAQKMEAIGRLAGGVAHDFNNLLTVILANAAEVLHSLGPDDPRGEDLEQVVKASRAASRLTGQLLAFARRQAIKPAVVDLNGLVRDTSSLLRRVVGEDCEVHVEMSDELWPVFVDRNQFEQVLINLVLNARDAVRGQGRIEIATTNVSGADEAVLLSVRDDGVGIDPEVLAHVFEPFFTTKEAGRGTGLGLATCYGIATQAGGTIEIQSQVGEGTCVIVRLPRAPKQNGVVSNPPPARPSHTGVGTVLVIEDDDAVRRVVERLLIREGYRVIAAASGEEALAAVEHEAALDVVLSDVMMPNMTGPEVVARVRRRFPSVSVLYMSGYAEDVLTLEAGAELIRKPFEPDRVAARLRELLTERAT